MEYFKLIRQLKLDDFNKKYSLDFENVENNEIDETIKKTLKQMRKLCSLKMTTEEKQEFERLENYIEILNENRPKLSNKIATHLNIYFLYGLFINFNKSINDEETKFFSSTVEDIPTEWSAFERGPILKSHYEYMKNDKDINIDWDNWTLLQQEVFKLGEKVLSEYSTKKLIEESQRTQPWINQWNKEKYGEIPSKDIKEYFEENALFFLR